MDEEQKPALDQQAISDLYARVNRHQVFMDLDKKQQAPGITISSICRYFPRQREFKVAVKKLGWNVPTYDDCPMFYHGVLLGIMVQAERNVAKRAKVKR